MRRLEAWPRAVDVSPQADPLIRELDRDLSELTDQRIAGRAGSAGRAVDAAAHLTK